MILGVQLVTVIRLSRHALCVSTGPINNIYANYSLHGSVTLLGLFDPEDESNTTIRNVEICLFNDRTP
jgi:hypothetical protein